MNTGERAPVDILEKLANDLFRSDGITLAPHAVKAMPNLPSAHIMEPQGGIENTYYFLSNRVCRDEVPKAFMSRTVDSLDVEAIRNDFPILQKRTNGRSLVWLDNGATTQKPACVIDKLDDYYRNYNSNVHRGAHTLSKLATQAYEKAREIIKDFIGAASNEEIIFVRGATEAINLVAESFGPLAIEKDDEILVTQMEHHSNIVPWQALARKKDAALKVIPFDCNGDILLDEYKKLLSTRTKIVALTHVSNVLGTINPIKQMTELAHQFGAAVIVDGAQSAPHLVINVKDIDCDFFVFSGHKMYGPTGIGVLYGKKSLLEQMPPWQKGGGMIKSVSFSETTYNGLPHKFEAGTGNIADAIGLGTAIEYIKKIGMQRIEQYEKNLTAYAMEALAQIPGLTLIGSSNNKICALSFVLDGIPPDKIAQYLNTQNIAVRSGHHCAQPTLQKFGLESSVRASIGVYNTFSEIRQLSDALLKLVTQ